MIDTDGGGQARGMRGRQERRNRGLVKAGMRQKAYVNVKRSGRQERIGNEYAGIKASSGSWFSWWGWMGEKIGGYGFRLGRGVDGGMGGRVG